jgi:N-acyl-D-aspartate/D-glutamate deacylase
MNGKETTGMDVILRGGQVLDVTGGPAAWVDVGLEGGRMAAIGEVPSSMGATEIDLQGLTLDAGVTVLAKWKSMFHS